MVHMLSRESKSVSAIASNPTLINALCGVTRYSSLVFCSNTFDIFTIQNDY